MVQFGRISIRYFSNESTKARVDSCQPSRLRRITERTVDPDGVTYVSDRAGFTTSVDRLFETDREKSGLRSMDLHWFARRSRFRRLSMRPTQEELEERNILKSKPRNNIPASFIETEFSANYWLVRENETLD